MMSSFRDIKCKFYDYLLNLDRILRIICRSKVASHKKLEVSKVSTKHRMY